MCQKNVSKYENDAKGMNGKGYTTVAPSHGLKLIIAFQRSKGGRGRGIEESGMEIRGCEGVKVFDSLAVACTGGQGERRYRAARAKAM